MTEPVERRLSALEIVLLVGLVAVGAAGVLAGLAGGLDVVFYDPLPPPAG